MSGPVYYYIHIYLVDRDTGKSAYHRLPPVFLRPQPIGTAQLDATAWTNLQPIQCVRSIVRFTAVVFIFLGC